jgi:hypothetical protein
VRLSRTRRDAVIVTTLVLCAACTHAGGPTSEHTPSDGSPHASAGTISSSADENSSSPTHCRAIVEDARLVRPFWLGNTHFEPAGARPKSTLADAQHAYSADPSPGGFRTAHTVFAFVRIAEIGGVTRNAGPAWLAISYDVPVVPSLSNHAVPSTQLIPFIDGTLKPIGVIQIGEPRGCRQ